MDIKGTGTAANQIKTLTSGTVADNMQKWQEWMEKKSKSIKEKKGKETGTHIGNPVNIVTTKNTFDVLSEGDLKYNR